MRKSVREFNWFFSGTLSWVVKVLLTIGIIAVVTASICITVFAFYIDRYIKPEVSAVDISSLTINYTSVVYATDSDTGEVTELEQLYNENNRIWVDYDQLSPNLYNAFVSTEDKQFYTHKGVDWVRTIGAMINMIIPLRENFGGGSTITQQLIKNLTGEDDVTVERKLAETLRALEFEKTHTKEDILELYLNVIYFGRGCYGVETAAQTYYGKSASELSLAECASIAAITKSPTYYDPIRRLEKNIERQQLILKNMLEQGYITQTQYDEAIAEELQPMSLESVNSSSQPKQSYYVDQVINDVLEDLQTKAGYSESEASNLLFCGGLKIYSCIDTEIQSIMDSVYQDTENLPHTTDVSQPQSAMVVIDPYTGYVVAMEGGVGEKTVNRAWNRATMTLRSPGSTIKPLTVYAPALEYGLITPATVLDDSPIDEETMYPKNENEIYSGRMTVKRSMELSTNTVAMKILKMVGLENAFNFGEQNLSLDLVRSVEVNGKELSDLNLSPLSMGGMTYGLTVLEVTSAYGAFVNHGIYTEPRTYTKVLDSDGKVILENEAEAHVAMKEKTAYYMNCLLTSVVENGTGTDAQLTSTSVAGKTGTTTNDHDRWFIGYTPDYVAGVWYGYDKGRELKMETEKNPAVEIWERVMSKVQENLPYEEFFSLETVEASYCVDSGESPSEYCELDPRGSRIETGEFLPEDVPDTTCSCHVPVTMCSASGLRATENCPSYCLYTVALLQVDRSGRVALVDDAYLYSEASTVTSGVITNPYATYCTVHSLHTSQENQSGGEYDPNALTNPDNSQGSIDENAGGNDEQAEEPSYSPPQTTSFWQRFFSLD